MNENSNISNDKKDLILMILTYVSVLFFTGYMIILFFKI